ncbi:MAG: hypothetical protein AAFO72_08750 [Pseudomonadota bacterium]
MKDATAEARAKKRKVTYAGLALVVALALAVSLKARHGAQDETRFSQVISEFINLSAAPDPRGLDFLSRDRVQRTNRAERLAHIQPSVLEALAASMDADEASLRAQITDPLQTNAFDYTGLVFDSPDDLEQGQAGPWSWAILEERAAIQAGETVELVDCGQDAPCRIWLLYWDETMWFYAPAGAQAFNDALLEAVPDLAGVVELIGENN